MVTIQAYIGGIMLCYIEIWNIYKAMEQVLHTIRFKIVAIIWTIASSKLIRKIFKDE
jgi:hypothetical protein